VAQPDVPLQGRPSQVEVAIAQPGFFGDVLIFGNREWRRLGLVQYADLPGTHFHLAGRHVEVDGVRRAPFDSPEDGHDKFRAQPLGALEQRFVAFDNDLGDAVAIAHVYEQQRTEVAHTVHPAEKNHLCVDIG